MTTPLTTQQKIIILQQKRAQIVEDSNKLLEYIALQTNGIVYVPVNEERLQIVNQLLAEGLVTKLPPINNQLDRVHITIKGHSRLLEMLLDIRKDEVRDYQRKYLRSSAFDIQQGT